MAEAIGLVASVAQLVSLSGALLAGGYSFLSTVSRAPSEIRSLLTETAAVNSLLGQLQLISEATTVPTTLNALQSLERLGVLKECRDTLDFVQKVLEKCQHEVGKDLQNFGRRLKWPFKEKETKDALQRLHNLRSVLANAVEIDSANTLRRVESGQKLLLEGMQTLTTAVTTQTSREEMQKVFSWFCPLSNTGTQVSLENALARRLPGTGKWFLESSTFTHWLASKESSQLSSIWITGLPGSGKTLLCASTIQKLLTMQTESKEPRGMTVLYFFCDHRDPNKLTHENFITTLTRQMLEFSPECMEHARKIYDEKANSGERVFNRGDYVSLIRSFMKLCKNIFICCDALDESSEGDEIASSLESLLAHGRKCGIPTRILFTSRFDVQLERRHTTITNNRVALADNMKSDIDQYVKVELDARIARKSLKLRDAKLHSVIRSQVVSRAGTILHARLHLDYLTTAKNDRELKAMTQNLPDGLEHTYSTLLNHMASMYAERVDDITILLKCLVIASPTLTAANLAEILAMEPGQSYLDFDCVATDPYDALEVIAPLVILTSSKKTHGVVKLSHFSFDEYLLSERILQGEAAQFHVDYKEGHAWLATTCLQYLTFDIFKAPRYEMSRFGSQSLDDYTFRRYAALNWFRHYREAGSYPGLKEHCQPYLNKLLSDERSPYYRRWQEMYRQELFDELYRYAPICFTISQGLDDIVDDLLPLLSDVNQTFHTKHTCLAMAAKWNRPSIIQKLIALGADLEKPNNRICTPLHLAAEFGSREATEVLLDAGANLHARSSSQSTPFYRACRGGSVHIVTRLKEAGCDINARTDDSWTPMMEAVENGHEPIVDLLLEWGADLTVKTDQGWTAFSIAHDGFNLKPNESVIEKLRRAVSKEVYEACMKVEDGLSDSDAEAEDLAIIHRRGLLGLQPEKATELESLSAVNIPRLMDETCQTLREG